MGGWLEAPRSVERGDWSLGVRNRWGDATRGLLAAVPSCMNPVRRAAGLMVGHPRRLVAAVVLGCVGAVGAAAAAFLAPGAAECGVGGTIGAWQDADGRWYSVSRCAALGRTQWSINLVTPNVVQDDRILIEYRGWGAPEPALYGLDRLSACPLPIDERPAANASMRERLVFGWPWGCWTFAQDLSRGGCIVSRVGDVDLAPVAWMASGYWRPGLPTGVLWGPFAGDSAAWTAGAWVLLAGCARVRRVLRRRAGACAGCGYSLAGLPEGARCPECGGRGEGGERGREH